ncbi:LA_2272 family surface repeat-containing protein [Treponema sp.]|uniref:LA_2272 family surface repeat-containing protein n=1 Tax=Treponema sp. TaxID=166 RepID=UPI00298DB06C|nr:caspase family protein [Treponema sp.]MCR5614368.1 caspase family protein [Treponema sp.]
MKKIFLINTILITFAFSLFAQNNDDIAGVERYAIYIGSNVGGKNNARLLYAGTDAMSFQKTMADIGGISKSNSMLLLDPTHDDVDVALKNISELILRNKGKAKRTEFIFYYSGHSDEYSLLLGKNKYDYSALKAAITEVPSDVHVVILDSCYSGNFIRSKGGSRQKPFLVDDSSVVKGHAYLSSSSSQESSQESDEIGSSFFTNAMITGLRGAADSSGDKKVTLNELYSYAFSETLSKTENTSTGPQHPNYNITLVGSGDLVLSDISNSDCVVTISKDLIGRVIIRDKNGKLVAEVNKTLAKPLYLALEEGQYGVTVIGENSTLQGNFSLRPGRMYAISTSNLSPVVRVANRTRGENESSDNSESTDESVEKNKRDSEDASDEEKNRRDVKFVPFVFSFVCNEFYIGSKKDIATIFALGLIRSHVYKVNGVMASGLINQADTVNGAAGAGMFNIIQNARGVESAGIFNITPRMLGLQTAGVFNIARDAGPVQGAGVFNIASDRFYGIQGAGVFNIAGAVKGFQSSGIFNIAGRGIKGVQLAGIGNVSGAESSGLQASAIFNVVKGDMHGAQIGLVNICGGDCGFQFGLVNISKNGVCEVGSAYTTNNNIRTVVNSGNKFLYAIGGFSMYKNFWIRPDKETNFYATLILGLGTRVKAGIVNFDFEVLSNQVFFSESAETVWYPSSRISVGVTPVKHLNIFAGVNLIFETPQNRNAFRYEEATLCVDWGEVKFRPEIDVGVRFSIN